MKTSNAMNAWALALGLCWTLACSDDASNDATAGMGSMQPGGNNAANAGSGNSMASAGAGGTEEPTVGTAALRVVHASPEAPEVDVYAKGSDTPAIEGLAYGEATGYLALPEGNYEFEVRAAGADPSEPALYTTPVLELAADGRYTAIAAGSVSADAPVDSAFRVAAFAEQFGDSQTNNFRLRIVHASQDAPTVGIDVGNDDAAAPEVVALDRFADTGEEGVELPAETALQVGVVAGGNVVTAFTVPDVIAAGSEVFVVATGLVGKTPGDDQGFSLLAVFGDGSTAWIKQNPLVYALHASTEAPAVDIFAGDAELVDNLAYGELSAPVQVPPGAYDLDFYVAEEGASARPADPPAVVGSTPMLEAGRRYLAVAAGPLAEFQLLGFADDFAGGTDESTLRVIHASADAPAVDVGTFSNGSMDAALISNLAYGSAAADDLVLPASSYDIGISAAGSTDTVAEFPGIALAEGQQAFVIASGDLAGTNIPFGLFVVGTTNSTLDKEWSVAPLANQK